MTAVLAAFLSGTLAALVVLAAHAGLPVLALTIALAVVLVAIGWAVLLDLPDPRGTAAVVALTGWSGVGATLVVRQTDRSLGVFSGLIALAVLQSIGNDYEEQARTLGADSWQSFRYVLLPLITPGIVPGSIIIFAYTFSSFEVPYLLGKSFPAMLSVLSYRLYINVDLDARPLAMAMSILIALFVLILVLVYRRLSLRFLRRAA